MLLPYRAKNPPEHFPYVTIALIVINTLIFALTSESFLIVREDVVQNFAISHNTFSLFRLFAAMFLHGSLFHLASNMLFLWIFGASVEGRLRPPLYIAFYLLAGLAGGMLHEVMDGITRPEQFSLGASGAVMGVAGMYLYMFPYSLICVVHRRYVFVGWGFAVSEWQARWVVAIYVGLDLLMAFISSATHTSDGVGHLAHLGGFGFGVLAVFALRARRDSEEVSLVQSTRTEMKDYSLLNYRDLATLMQHPTEDMDLVLAYCEKCLSSPHMQHPDQAVQTLRHYIRPLMEKADPSRLAWILLALPLHVGGIPPVHYLRLASRMEAIYSNDYAARLYRRIYDLYPQSSDTEVALYRLASLTEKAFQDPRQAHIIYNEMLRLFPNGQMALEARRALQGHRPG